MWLASKVDYDSFRANQLPPSMVDLGMWYVCMLHRPIVHNYGASPTTPPSYIRVVASNGRPCNATRYPRLARARTGNLYHRLPPHHNRFTALFPGPPRWADARRELLDFMVQGKINRGRHSDHPAGRHSIRSNQCPPPPSQLNHRLVSAKFCDVARLLQRSQ